MKILIDCAGGDKAYSAPIEGAKLASKDFDAEIILIGNEENMKKTCNDFKIIASENDISNEDKGIEVIKKKKSSSMVQGMMMVKNGEVDAFVSAGNTGAMVAGATLFAGRLEGILRPALAPLLPTRKGVMMLIDGGANLECRPEFLYQFGVMGAVYMKNVEKIFRPKVGLLNVGVEEGKGLENIKDAYALLNKPNENFEFVGNIEGRDFVDGICDVLVAEGFAGNVMLKSVEGVGSFVKSELKEAIYGSTMGKLGGLLLKKQFMAFMDKLDYTKYGGAPLLGVNGAVIKAHGSSNATAFYHAIRQAVGFVESNVNSNILNGIKKP